MGSHGDHAKRVVPRLDGTGGKGRKIRGPHPAARWKRTPGGGRKPGRGAPGPHFVRGERQGTRAHLGTGCERRQTQRRSETRRCGEPVDGSARARIETQAAQSVDQYVAAVRWKRSELRG